MICYHKYPTNIGIINGYATSGNYPTNIVSANLVMGCPNARAGVGIVGKKTLRATKFRPLR